VAVIIVDIMNIIPLFPIPVLSCDIELEESEKAFLLGQYPDKVRTNWGNLVSLDNNILKNKEVKVLEKKLLSHINEAFNLIHSPQFKCKLYITQSWLNFTGKGQFHPRHNHPNSIFSAVLYLRTTDGDLIEFHNSHHNDNYQIVSNHNDIFNSGSWKIPVKDNLLLIFPSTLEHSVPNLMNDNLRVSLSFNTFFKGQLGQPEGLTHLVL